jgi:hypothetical protein
MFLLSLLEEKDDEEERDREIEEREICYLYAILFCVVFVFNLFCLCFFFAIFSISHHQEPERVEH